MEIKYLLLLAAMHVGMSLQAYQYTVINNSGADQGISLYSALRVTKGATLMANESKTFEFQPNADGMPDCLYKWAVNAKEYSVGKHAKSIATDKNFGDSLACTDATGTIDSTGKVTWKRGI